jgi:hypothetical protein
LRPKAPGKRPPVGGTSARITPAPAREAIGARKPSSSKGLGSAGRLPRGGDSTAAEAPALHGAAQPARSAVVNHPAVGSEQLALAALAVTAGLDPRYLDPVLASALSTLVKSEPPTELASTARIEGIDRGAAYRLAKDAIGPDSVRTALFALAETVHAGAVQEARSEDPDRLREPMETRITGLSDLQDWNREWGLALLSRDHPRLRSGAYLVGWNQEGGQNRSHFSTIHARRSPSNAKERFERRLESFAPNLRMMAYTGSGSDAVNLCFDLARQLGLARLAPGVEWKDLAAHPYAKLAFFEGAYGGGRGESVGINWEGYAQKHRLNLEPYKLPSPLTARLPVEDPQELARLHLVEGAALAKLRALAHSQEHPIGGVFLEPIPASYGVLWYRPEFLRALRALTDELGLAIIADEILTGGGRTARFFSYEHYQGFEPDFITMGKGLQVAGLGEVLRPHRKPTQLAPLAAGITTAEGNAADFHKGAEVLAILEDEKLMERASKVGERLAGALAEIQRAARIEPDATAVGCLVGWTPPPYMDRVVVSADGRDRDRLMPPLDLSDETLDDVIEQMRGIALRVARFGRA